MGVGPELLRPLYQKNGWPGENFDGDAFLVDFARARAARIAKYKAEEPMRKVSEAAGSIAADGSEAVIYLQRKMREAATVDERCLVQWQLWELERRNQYARKALEEAETQMARIYPDGRCQKPEELPLWECSQLQEMLASAKCRLQTIQQPSSVVETDQGEKPPILQAKLHYAEEQVAIYQRACEASLADAERLCPGRIKTFRPAVEEICRPDAQKRTADMILVLQERIKAIEEWVAGLPDGAYEARKAAQYEMDNCVSTYERYRHMADHVDQAVKFYRRRWFSTRTSWY